MATSTQPLSGVVERLLGVRKTTDEGFSRAAEVELQGTPEALRMVVHVINPGEFTEHLTAGETYPLILVAGKLTDSEIDQGLVYRATPSVVVNIRSGDLKNDPDEIELEVDTEYFPQTAEVPDEAA